MRKLGFLCFVLIFIFSVSLQVYTSDSEQAELDIIESGGLAPDSIFREYKWNGPYDKAGGWLPVTDPNAPNPEAQKSLPNETYNFNIDDLEGTVRAEMYIEIWGGHAGTSNKRVMINGNEWIKIPESPYIGPAAPTAYLQYRFPVVPLDLYQLVEGENNFQFTSGPQLSNDFGWGQWGVAGITFRIYYNDKKINFDAVVKVPESRQIVDEKVELGIDLTEGSFSDIKKVDYIGYYKGFDYNGDGKFKQWQYNYRFGRIQYHIGTAKKAPFNITWDTSWIPDQEDDIKIMGRITTKEGICYMTPISPGLELIRDNYSVEICKPYRIPINYIARAGNTMCNNVDVEGDLSRAIDARIVLSTWSGAMAEEIGINDNLLVENVGKFHLPSIDVIPVDPDLIKPGTNKLYTYSSTEHHGIEVCYPGMVLFVKYKY